MTHKPLERIDRAVEIVGQEIAVTETERDAYRRFVKRIDDIEPTASLQTGGVMTAVTTTTATARRDQLDRIEQAYRETVMATPHFEREYGESFTAHLSEEFGPELATRLGNATVVTPQLYDGLQRATATAIQSRERYRRILRRERDSVTACASEIQNVNESVQELHARLETAPESHVLGMLDERLAALETTCEAGLAERQQLVANRTTKTFAGIGETSLTQHLYGEFEVVYPAIATFAEYIRTIRNCRRRCLR